MTQKFITIDGGTYINQVRTDKFTKDLSLQITQNCTTGLCEVQKMLDYVSVIPYKINNSIARSGKNVIKNNYGDCDDKSNLLISMLHAQGYEAYFVFVPRHVFIVVAINEELRSKKALYVNKKPFYILESTATHSKVGFPLKYQLQDIHAVIDPFINKKISITSLDYKF
ncbi:MAG: transglutaminase domain-containing protein [Campylobacteraceae bacterium]|nr:transglutaminase domain-containing protein [Campylobacteraceae bacterium]